MKDEDHPSFKVPCYKGMRVFNRMKRIETASHLSGQVEPSKNIDPDVIKTIVGLVRWCEIKVSET